MELLNLLSQWQLKRLTLLPRVLNTQSLDSLWEINALSDYVFNGIQYSGQLLMGTGNDQWICTNVV